MLSQYRQNYPWINIVIATTLYLLSPIIVPLLFVWKYRTEFKYDTVEYFEETTDIMREAFRKS